MRFQTNTAAAGNLRLPVTQRNNARRNSSRLPLMPHRALFVSQCHHFSPVIYFIAIAVFLAPAVSAAVAAMPFLLLHLRSPHPPLFFSSTSTTTSSSSFSSTRSFSLSFFIALSSTLSPVGTVPTNTFSFETLHYHTIQHNSTLSSPSRRDFIIHFCLCLARLASLSHSSVYISLSLSLALPRSPAAFRREEREKERKEKERHIGRG